MKKVLLTLLLLVSVITIGSVVASAGDIRDTLIITNAHNVTQISPNAFMINAEPAKMVDIQTINGTFIDNGDSTLYQLGETIGEVKAEGETQYLIEKNGKKWGFELGPNGETIIYMGNYFEIINIIDCGDHFECLIMEGYLMQ